MVLVDIIAFYIISGLPTNLDSTTYVSIYLFFQSFKPIIGYVNYVEFLFLSLVTYVLENELVKSIDMKPELL